MARLGVRTVDELVGRTDLLKRRENLPLGRASQVDLSMILDNPYEGRDVAGYSGKQVFAFHLEDTMDELLNKISNQFLFQIEEPESASVVIGTARAGHFSWRVENGFRDIFSVEQWLRDNPEFSIYDEYGTAITWEQFKEAVAWCNG